MKYLRLLLLLAFFCPPGVAQKKSTTPATLHMLYVMEQEDAQYGLLNLKNEELMNQIVSTVKWALGYTMTTTYLVKKDFTSAALNKAIAALKTGPQDIIVLYYAGLSLPTANPSTRFANWKLRDLPEQGLPVDEVESWLTAKKGHLKLLIADCNAQLVVPQPVKKEKGSTPTETMAERTDFRRWVTNGLFLDSSGVVKIGSSLPVKPAWANAADNRSLFMGGLSQAFEVLFRATQKTAPPLTFQSLMRQAKGLMSTTIDGVVYSQEPVLETKLYKKSTIPVIDPTPTDTLTTDELDRQLFALVISKEPLQRTAIANQLLAYCAAGATVSVSRSFSNGPNMMPYIRKANYPIRTYINQIHRPQPKPKGAEIDGALYLQEVNVWEKQQARSATSRIRKLVVEERWYPEIR